MRGGEPPRLTREGVPLPSNSPPFPQRVLFRRRRSRQDRGHIRQRIRQRRCPHTRTAPFFVDKDTFVWNHATSPYAFCSSSRSFRAFSRTDRGTFLASPKMCSKQAHKAIRSLKIPFATETLVFTPESVTTGCHHQSYNFYTSSARILCFLKPGKVSHKTFFTYIIQISGRIFIHLYLPLIV